MPLRNKSKQQANNLLKKVTFAIIKPFLPYIIAFLILLFAFCTVVNAIFVDDVQKDFSSETYLEIKNACFEKAEYLNTCNNYIDGRPTKKLLDKDNKENDKKIQWSHLYSLMTFHNLIDNSEIDYQLLDEISENFESTFIYETYYEKTEDTTLKQDDKNSIIGGQTVFLLVESHTIMGNYKYHYQEVSTTENNIKTTKKVLSSIELVGEQYSPLKKYLKNKLHVPTSEIDTDVQIVIEAANGYYDGKENTAWLQEDSSSAKTVTDGKVLAPKGMFIWPIPGYTTITSHFGNRAHPITGVYHLHAGLDVGAPIGADFVAMADGTVIRADYSSSYGNVVMIDHGNNIVTLYAHGSQLLVSKNQVVKQGQPVLKVGSTGDSTGPHAHFEVRINGKFTDPESYFETNSEGGN